MADYAPDVPPSNISVYAQALAETMVEVLRRAGDDLNRRSLVAAAEALQDFTCSLCLAPINMSPTDHRPNTSLRIMTVDKTGKIVLVKQVSVERKAEWLGK